MSFSKTKANLIESIKSIIECLKVISEKEKIITKSDNILKEFCMKNVNFNVENIIENLENNLSMVERSTMKCVFIGNISNGKSCTINAILKQKILPSARGCTTSCFISVKGYEGNEIYLEDTHGKRCPVADLGSLGNQLSVQKCSVDSLLRVFIPRNMCELLENDLEIIDCPGANNDKTHDQAIIKHCKDADVFVLVVHAENTLSLSDRELFAKLKGHLSNLIVVVNKWDLGESDEEKEQLRKQHQDKINEYLSKDLAKYSLDEANKRTFFISSLHELKNTGSDNNLSLEFNKFKDALSRDSNKHAIESKIDYYLAEVEGKKKLTLKFLTDLRNYIMESKRFNYNTMKQQIMMKSKDKISEIFKNINEESMKLLDDIALKLTNIKEACKKRAIDDECMPFLEDMLVLKLYKCFENSMKSLPDQIKKIFIQNSCIDMDGNKMERFSQLSTHVDNSIKEYKEYIEASMKNISLEYQEQFQNEKSPMNMVQIQIQIYKALGDTISYVVNPRLWQIPIKSWFSHINNIETDKNLVNQINAEIKRFLSCNVEIYLEKLNRETDDIVMNCLNEFIEDQRNMDDLVITFDNLRVEI